MAKSEKSAAWERYTKYVYERDTRKRSAPAADSCPDVKPEPPVSPVLPVSEENEMTENASENISENIIENIPENDSENIPENIPEETAKENPEKIPEEIPAAGESEENLPCENVAETPSQSGTDRSENIPEEPEVCENNPEEAEEAQTEEEPESEEKSLKEILSESYRSNKTVYDIVFTVVLAAFYIADTYAMTVMAKKYVPEAVEKIFRFLRLDTVDASSWKPELFKNVSAFVISLTVAGFALFLVEMCISKLLAAIGRKKLTGPVAFALPVLLCGLSVIFCLKMGIGMASLCIPGTVFGGLLYLILAKLSLEIPVNSVKTDNAPSDKEKNQSEKKE